MQRSRNTPQDLMITLLDSDQEWEIESAVQGLFGQVSQMENTSAFLYLASLLMQTSSRHQQAQQIALLYLDHAYSDIIAQRDDLKARLTQMNEENEVRMVRKAKNEKYLTLRRLRKEAGQAVSSDLTHQIERLETDLDQLLRHIRSAWEVD